MRVMIHSQPLGACALLFNSRGEILLGKRKNSYKSGSYGLPGGRIELNEPMLEAIRREVLEETGLSVIDFSYVGAVRENQDSYDFVHFVFTAEVGDEEPRLCEPDKCEGWEWMDPEALPSSLLPGHQAAVELFLNYGRLADLTS